MAQSIAFDVIARDKASSTFSKISRSADSTTGRLTKFGKLAGLSLAGVGVAAGALVKTSIGLEASFSKTMAQVAASTDAPKSAMAGMSKLAMKLGAETKFSANEAAGAMLELAKAGITTSDIMGGALKGTLLLAAAGDTDLATASTIAANAMNTFNLRGRDMNKIAAALAGGANASSASVESLGQALQQVGPGATNAGLSLQQTVGVLSAFDAAGIKGSDAGTSLKTMLSRLVPSTEKASAAMRKYNLDFTDAEGNFVSITNVAQQLREGLGGLSESQRTAALSTIFGSDATRAATVLMKQGAAGVQKYIRATKDQNAAQKMAKANMSGTAGALERLKGSIETAELALGKALAPTIQKTADFLSNEAVPALTKFIEGMQNGTGPGGDLADVIGDIAGVAETAVKFIDGLPGPVKKFGAEGLIAFLVLTKLSAGLTAAGASAGITGARLMQLRAEMTYTATRGQVLGAAMARFGAAAKTAAGVGGMLLLAHSTRETNQSMKFFETALGGALTGLMLGGAPGAAFGLAAGAMAGLARATHQAAVETITAADKVRHYVAALRGLSNIHSEEARAEALKTINKKYDDFLGFTERLKISQRDLVGIVTGEAGARQRVAAVAARAAKSQNESTRAAGNGTKVLLDFLDGERARLTSVTQANHRHNQTVATLKTLVSQLPKEVRTAIKQPGAVKSIKDVADLQKKYKLTPAQVQTIIEAKRVKATTDDIQKVINKAKEFGRQRPAATLNVRDNASPRIRSILATLHSLQNQAFNIPLGIKSSAGSTGQIGHRASGGPVAANSPYIVGEQGPELFVPKSSGLIIPNGMVSASGTASRVGERTGSSFMDGILKGIRNRNMTLGAALDRVTRRLEGVRSRIERLQDTRSGFKGTFANNSIFGADIETSGSSISSLKQFSQAEARKAQQLLADVRRVQSLGLSGSLLKQLQSSGTQGADILHLLAQGSASDIRAFNASNAATMQSLQAAGLSLGNGIRGGDINADIRVALRQERYLERMLHELRHLSRNQQWVVRIDAAGLMKIIRRGASAAGKTPTQYLNGS